MRIGRQARRVALACALAVASCGEARPEAEPDPRPPAVRRLVEPDWEELFRIGDSLQDTLLLQPGRLAADAGGVTLADLHGGRVLRFDRTGRLLWSFGRKGRGPDELAHPRDLKLDAAGRAWILDAENGRILVLSPDGRPLRRIRLDAVGRRPDDLVPMADGHALVLLDDPERPLARVDATGAVLERRPFPWHGFAALDPMAAQLVVASEPASGRWAAAFQAGDGFVAYEGDRWLGYVGHYVEPVPFPAVVESRRGSRVGRSETVTRLADPVFAAWSATLSPERLYVLFVGRTERAGRLLDAYDPRHGAYVETFLLPRRVKQVAWGDGVLYATYADPYPTLVAWRPVGIPLP